MDSRWLGVIVLVIIVALGGWYVFSHPTPSPAPVVETPPTPEVAPPTAAAPAPVTVTYTDTGFSPKSVTIAAGQTVSWVNQSSKQMWVASAMHPSHTAYNGTSKDAHCAPGYTGTAPFDECGAVGSGGSFTFTFDKAGDWKYHNHANAADFGDVVVTATPAAGNAGVTASTSANVNVQ